MIRNFHKDGETVFSEVWWIQWCLGRKCSWLGWQTSVTAWNRNCQQWNSNYGPLPYHYSRIHCIINSAISNHLNHIQWPVKIWLNATNICKQLVTRCENWYFDLRYQFKILVPSTIFQECLSWNVYNCMQKIIQCNKKKTIFQSFMKITQGNNYPSWFTFLMNCNINWGNGIYALPLQILPTTY